MFENRQLDGFVELSDNELIQLFREGSQIAFQQLALRYLFVIKGIAADLYTESMDFDDLMQEGFLALHSAANTYRQNAGASFRTYAGVCIRNRLVSAVRLSRKSLPTAELSEDIPDIPENEPENAFIIKEDFACLVQYIENSLSDTELKVLSLYLDGKSYDEIAALLNITRKSCDNAMQRVRRKLKSISG